MKAWARLRQRISARRLGESDAPADLGVASSRDEGGGPALGGDTGGTTGTGESDEFVGRIGGQDLGYAGLTGAEVRCEAEQERRRNEGG